MILKVKKLSPEAVIPAQQTMGAAGMDLTAIGARCNVHMDTIAYSTGLAVEIPAGYVGLLFPRSSIWKIGLSLANAVGVIDSDYRGEIQLIFRWVNKELSPYVKGDRVGQLVIVPIPEVTIEETECLTETTRGLGGFGSTGS